VPAAGQGSLPAAPETVVLYLSTLAETAKVSTLTRRISAISQAHQAAGLETPTAHLMVRKLMAGIRRSKGTAQTGKRPLAAADLRALFAPLDSRRILDVRDRALLLVGFAGAFRRSELVGLDVTDLAFNTAGLIVNIRRSKTDQEGQGRRVGIPYGSTPATCPVRALEAWLAALGADEGPLFRAINRHGQLAGRRLTAQSVALVIKRLAAQAGMEADDLAGHSLRAGLATAAAAAGVPERAIMAQTGHRSLATLRKYIREGSLLILSRTPPPLGGISYLDIDFIAAGTTPQAVVDYHPSAEARACVAALIAREKEGGLAAEEKAELDHFMDLEHILRMAKARARQILTSGP
jgi:integrase